MLWRTARRTLKRLEACCDWAVRRKHIPDNPFLPLLRDIRKPRSKKSWMDTRAFTTAERDAILEAIAGDCYANKYGAVKHSYYLSYYQFLFWTGCRLEESSPLKWAHIEPDYSVIHFQEALPADTRILGDIKTQVHREFPCNQRLRSLLRRLPHQTALVFPSPKGVPIDYHNLLKRLWKPIVTNLVAKGMVREYLPHKHTRHTFITLAKQAGMSDEDIAQLVGNSPEVINKHYKAPKPRVEVPEF